MTNIINHINTYADLTAYDNDKEKDYPNVSYLVATDEVKWVKDDSVHIVCKYNVTSTESATKLLNSNTGITYQIIDGIKQDAVQTSYTFDTLGEHIVEYKLDGTSIVDNAFQNCEGLTSVTIPDSVTSIGMNAFKGCTSLTSVTIPDSVTSIGTQAFYGCTGLTNITIPNSVTSIGSSAFLNCKGLTNITIPDSVTSIGEQAFYGCTGLTSITIPNSVTSIGRAAFNSCSGLTSVTIGNGVTSIGSSAFSYCEGLTSIVVNSANTVYDSRDNCNAIINTSTNELIAGCKNTVIPNTVTSIGEQAFLNCSGLTSITIPNSVTSIDEGAFVQCTGLTSITIPNSVTSIGNGAFENCRGLTSVTIGNGVTSIGKRAFTGCTGLTDIIVEAITPPTLGEGVFNRNASKRKIYVPAESLEAYWTTGNWVTYAADIEAIPE